MKKDIVYILFAAVLLSMVGCSQNSDPINSCYSDKLPGKDKVLTTMLNKPQFRGGNDSLINFLSNNISFEKFVSNLPQKEQIFNDTARIKFIISDQGSLSDLSVTLAKKKMFAEEIARVIKKSSCNWVPGSTGQLANGWFQFDIYFSVSTFNNEVKTTMTFIEHVPQNEQDFTSAIVRLKH